MNNELIKKIQTNENEINQLQKIKNRVLVQTQVDMLIDYLNIYEVKQNKHLVDKYKKELRELNEKLINELLEEKYLSNDILRSTQ